MKRSGARFDRRTFNAPKRVNRGTMTRTRITPMNSIAPPRTGGFWGVNVRRKTEERKVIDVAPGTLVADTTGTITALNLVATGTDFTNRIGRKILMRSIYIRYRVNNFDNTTVNNCSRVILVYDMQTNGALPAITDVLDTIHAESQVNLNNRDRFRIIWDKIHAIGQFDTTATQAIAGSPTIHVGKKYKKLRLETIFSGTTAAIGSIATGGLYLITVGDAAANAGGLFTLSTRIRFEDS